MYRTKFYNMPLAPFTGKHLIALNVLTVPQNFEIIVILTFKANKCDDPELLLCVNAVV
jgi:hypothetical protein